MIRGKRNRAFALCIMLTGIVSCSPEVNYDQMIKDQITNFYTEQDVRAYKPISYGDFDTLPANEQTEGSSLEIKGIVAHEYQGLDNNGDTTRFEDTFDVTIYKDVVVVIPRGY